MLALLPISCRTVIVNDCVFSMNPRFAQNSQKLAVEFIESGVNITASHINKIFTIFNLHVTDK